MVTAAARSAPRRWAHGARSLAAIAWWRPAEPLPRRRCAWLQRPRGSGWDQGLLVVPWSSGELSRSGADLCGQRSRSRARGPARVRRVRGPRLRCPAGLSGGAGSQELRSFSGREGRIALDCRARTARSRLSVRAAGFCRCGRPGLCSGSPLASAGSPPGVPRLLRFGSAHRPQPGSARHTASGCPAAGGRDAARWRRQQRIRRQVQRPRRRILSRSPGDGHDAGLLGLRVPTGSAPVPV